MQIRRAVTPSGATVVYPEGDLDMTGAPAVRERLHALVQAGNTRLVVDLSAVDTIDSTGLGALISGLKAARKNGGDLRIAKPNATVVALLELTSVDCVLKSFESPDSAFP